MKVWSYQTLDAYRTLQNTGVLSSTRERVCIPYVIPMYDVLREIMTRKIGPPPSQDTYPMWVWVRARKGKRYGGRKPTRRYKGNVLLTLEVPEDRLLVTDFTAWGICLNHGALLPFEGPEDQEMDRLTAGLTQEDPRRLALVAPTWERLYDLPWCMEHIYESENPRGHRLQGTLWEIRQEDVVKVEHLQYAQDTWEAHLKQEAYWDSKQAS